MNINILLNNCELKRRLFMVHMNIPEQIPATQSIFYMPLITFAYSLVKCQKQQKKITSIPNDILNSVSIFFVLFDNNRRDELYKLLCHTTSAIYDYVMCHYNEIEDAYKKDGGIPMNKVSHIRDAIQENILTHSIMDGIIFNNFVSMMLDIYPNDVQEVICGVQNSDIQRTVKLMIDMCIQMRYSKK